MRLPRPRGPVSRALLDTLRRPVHRMRSELARLGDGRAEGDALCDEDLQLTLFVCYELHYRGFDSVAAEWEWEPSLLALRAAAERRFVRALRDQAGAPVPVGSDSVAAVLAALTGEDGGPTLSGHLERAGTLDQFREFVVHRSIYHLKEADPFTWAIPRLDGPAKAALVEIQIDEYGGGRLPRMHAELFRRTMACLHLDTSYGGYLDAVPAVTLATVNLISLFGLHRRWRGALLGHLAAFEMTSSVPNRRYGDGLRRLGGSAEATRFFDEHVEADAVHEQVAAHDLCGAFLRAEPARAPDVAFGAACCLALDRLFGAHLLDRWRRGRSSLCTPLPAAA